MNELSHVRNGAPISLARNARREGGYLLGHALLNTERACCRSFPLSAWEKEITTSFSSDLRKGRPTVIWK